MPTCPVSGCGLPGDGPCGLCGWHWNGLPHELRRELVRVMGLALAAAADDPPRRPRGRPRKRAIRAELPGSLTR